MCNLRNQRYASAGFVVRNVLMMGLLDTNVSKDLFCLIQEQNIQLTDL